MLQFAVSVSYHSCLIFVLSFRAIGAGREGMWSLELGNEVEGR